MNERARLVVTWREAGLSHVEIGRRLGVTPQRAAGIAQEAAWDERLAQRMRAAGVDGLLSRRVFLVLVRAGLRLEDTAALSDDDLLGLPNLGAGALAEIRRAASSRGLGSA